MSPSWSGAQPLLLREGQLPTAVLCTVAALTTARPTLALLDTGASLTIIEDRLVDLLGLHAVAGERTERAMDSRYGTFHGRLIPLEITLAATEGRALAVQARVFVTDDVWPGPTILGVTGFLEHVRIGLLPAPTPDDPAWFCFGAA